MTKMMCVYTALSLIPNLNKKVTITKAFIKNKTKYSASLGFLKVGSRLSYKDLLYGVLYPSGADACWSLARSLCGSEIAFVKKMNKQAKALGMTKTHFTNTTGLPDTHHVSSCVDLTKLMQAGLKKKMWAKIFLAGPYATYHVKGLTWKSTLDRMRSEDHVLARKEIKGAKSGWTKSAGYCLASLAKIHGDTILIVTAKGDKNYYQVSDQKKGATALLDHNRIVDSLKQNGLSVVE
jgi:D-alanyl-D-alanine carboxypeptidase